MAWPTSSSGARKAQGRRHRRVHPRHGLARRPQPRQFLRDAGVTWKGASPVATTTRSAWPRPMPGSATPHRSSTRHGAVQRGALPDPPPRDGARVELPVCSWRPGGRCSPTLQYLFNLGGGVPDPRRPGRPARRRRGGRCAHRSPSDVRDAFGADAFENARHRPPEARPAVRILSVPSLVGLGAAGRRR